ncbi:hypothetical protein [Latilactobacillus graminis]|uniref:Lipoprotein n=2 Tax=Latilactobacillus graminis TaxID=60519 RepID=A0AA89HZT4_9LACO|nr:hypothetical protein [Latilactobacillus graminis]KRM20977.1 lipoprotein [Latilactobacillus graminis DSM 20719]QFP79118.1 hypothetical protein LG542_02235 [Latilactobacillus graminis]
MFKLLKCLFPIMLIGIILSACQKPLDTKHQLQTDMQTVLQATKRQQVALSTLETIGDPVPDNYLTLQKKHPNQNLLTVEGSKIATTATKRSAAFQDIKTQQTLLKPVIKRLIMISEQENNELPIEQIKDLNQSLKISTLDYTTLSTFYDAATTAEDKFYTDHTDADVDQETLKSPINRLNQYYSSVYQQAEIAKVNMNTVAANAKKIQKQLN